MKLLQRTDVTELELARQNAGPALLASRRHMHAMTIWSDLQACIKVLLLYAEEATTKEALMEATIDEVRGELATSDADLADEGR